MDPNSSYHKIYVALAKTESWRKLIETIELKLHNAKLRETIFDCVACDEYTRVYPVFIIDYGFSKTERWSLRNNNDSDQWYVAFNNFWNPAEFKHIVNTHFGSDKDVGTRNCKIDIVFAGLYKRNIESFYSWGSKILEDCYRGQTLQIRDRLREECLKVIATDEYRKTLKEAEVQFCKDTITSAMMKWRHMPDETLREAFNQFITTSVMEE